MKRYQCIRDILDCFDFYEAYVIRVDLDAWFRCLLYGWKPSKQITRPVGLCAYETRQAVFRRVFRAYVFRAVREGRAAGLDYLTICYALCRKISAALMGEEGYDPMARFSMVAYARMLNRSERRYSDRIENVKATAVKVKLAFLREEREKRIQRKGAEDEQRGFHIEFPEPCIGAGKGVG